MRSGSAVVERSRSQRETTLRLGVSEDEQRAGALGDARGQGLHAVVDGPRRQRRRILHALHQSASRSPSHAQVVLPHAQNGSPAPPKLRFIVPPGPTMRPQLPDSGSSVRTVVTWAER